jgi:hypothetical protein
MRLRRTSVLKVAAALGTVLAIQKANALDKQGSAHGGAVTSENGEKGFDVSGSLTLGVSLINQTYAARPDNTGLALMRYAGHADVDLIGRTLSIPVDVNVFTDKTRQRLDVLAPTELDVIAGVTTTHPAGRGGDLELGARVEHDRPVDRPGFTQSYLDVRSRYLYSLAKVWPSLARDLVDGDINGYLTLGWFAFNPTYAARPDNTGIALLRYVAHTELSVLHDYISIGVDGTMFTDRRSPNPVRPTELDLTYEFIVHVAPFEWHVAYERDMPVGSSSLVQDFVYALLVYDFDLKHAPAPLEPRGSVPSP